MINRAEALDLVRENCKNENLVKHMISVEGVMRELAIHFQEDEDKWGITGLLHDLDYDYTFDTPKLHGIKTIEILGDLVDDEMKDAILSHNEENGTKERKTLLAKSLYAADPISGLITAAILMRPIKTMDGYKSKSLKKKFKSKSFAAGANREQILTCSEIDLELNNFFQISIKGMQRVAKDIGF